jgi:lysophospholipase L1-like esterase
MKKILNSSIRVFLVIVIVLVIAELIFRVLGFGNLEVYNYDPDLYWVLKPNQKRFTKVNRRLASINSFGFRGKEITQRKPKNTIRILSTGDSRTYGWGVSDDETYSSVLEFQLNGIFKDTGIKTEVLNNGVNGYSYPQIYESIKKNLDKLDIDIVIVGMANLWTCFQKDNSQIFKNRWKRSIILKNFLRSSALYHVIVELKLANLYQRLRLKFIPFENDAYTKIYSYKNSHLGKEIIPEDYELLVINQYLEAIANFLRVKNKQCVFIYLPYNKHIGDTRENENMKKEIQNKYTNVIFINANDIFLKYHHIDSSYLEKDPVHLSKEGHRLLGQYIAEKLKGFLQKY